MLFAIAFTSFSQVTLSGFYPSTGASGSGFGLATALDQNNYVVSSNSSIQFNQGKVYVFSLNNGTMTQENILFEDDALATDQFGKSVSIEGDYIVVGSPKHKVDLTNQGAIYIYKYIDGNWTFFQKITAFDASAEDQFGSYVKIYNNTIFVSSIDFVPSTDTNIQNNPGAIYIYNLNETNWEFEAKLTMDGSTNFGNKIEVVDDMMIVSAYMPNQGNIYHTFTFNDSWTYTDSTAILGSLEEIISDFTFDGEHIYITSKLFTPSNFINKISILTRTNNIWNIDATIPISVATIPILSNDYVSGKIQVSENNMLVGFSGYILAFSRKSPVIYYKKINNQWVYQTLLYGEGAFGIDDYFGLSISLQSSNCLIGAPYEGFINQGKAYATNLENLNIKTFEKDELTIYPNPTSDEIHFNQESFFSVTKFEIYSTLGKLVQSGKMESTFLSLKSYQNGMYFIQIHFQDGSQKTFKIIKK